MVDRGIVPWGGGESRRLQRRGGSGTGKRAGKECDRKRESSRDRGRRGEGIFSGRGGQGLESWGIKGRAGVSASRQPSEAAQAGICQTRE